MTSFGSMPEIIPVARSYKGVPFYHAGRDRNGVDCIGLIVCVARDLGYSFKDDRNYSPGIYPERMFTGMEQFCHRVDDRQPGDILVFDYRGRPMHCAILTGDDLIVHCDGRQSIHKVVETSLGRYANRIHSVWRFN